MTDDELDSSCSRSQTDKDERFQSLMAGRRNMPNNVIIALPPLIDGARVGVDTPVRGGAVRCGQPYISSLLLKYTYAIRG